MKKTNHKQDLIVLFILLFVAVFYAYLTKGTYLGNNLFSGIVLTIPSVIYLGLRKKKNWKKLILASLIFGVLFGFALSFYAEATKSWSTNTPIFNYRVFGMSALEEILGQGIMALLVFTFYEHFFDNERKSKLNKRVIWAILLGIFGSLFLILLHEYLPQKFSTFEYPYVVVGTIAILPLIYILIKRPGFLPKLVLTGVYFFILWFVIEFQAVAYNYWLYPGNYIGWVDILGVRYPFEELFYWMMLYAPTIIVYYEFSIDDGK